MDRGSRPVARQWSVAAGLVLAAATRVATGTAAVTAMVTVAAMVTVVGVEGVAVEVDVVVGIELRGRASRCTPCCLPGPMEQWFAEASFPCFAVLLAHPPMWAMVSRSICF